MAVSEPDEGTTITIHLPAIPDTPENQKLLESGHYMAASVEGKASDVKQADMKHADSMDAGRKYTDRKVSDATAPDGMDTSVKDSDRREGGNQHV